MGKKYLNIKTTNVDWKELIYQAVMDEDRPSDLPIPEDYEESVMYLLSMLTDRERNLILLRYRDKNTYKDCGNSIGVGIERARQIIHHGLRCLRRPYRKKSLCMG